MPKQIPPPWIELATRRRENFTGDLDRYDHRNKRKPKAARARRLSPDERRAIEAQMRKDGTL